MQTRIIQTRFYKDSAVLKMSLYAQHLFIYLLTCEHINLTGVFELPDVFIMLEAKLTIDQLEIAKGELMGKIEFNDSWVYVVNARKNNKYEKSPMNKKAMIKEYSRVPVSILSRFGIDTSMDTTIDTSNDSSYKPEIIINKPETRNQNSGIASPVLSESAKTLVSKLENIRFKKIGETKLKKELPHAQAFLAHLKSKKKNVSADELFPQDTD